MTSAGFDDVGDAAEAAQHARQLLEISDRNAQREVRHTHRVIGA